MQRAKPLDMSLPDRIAVLERGLEKERNKRRFQNQLIREMSELLAEMMGYETVIMEFLDGTRIGSNLFRKEAIKRGAVLEKVKELERFEE